MSSFLLLRPLWLLGLPVLAALGWSAFRKSGRFADWAGIIDKELLPVLAEIGHIVQPQSRSGPMASLIVATVLCVALSGPSIRRDDAPSFQNLDGVMLIIDMSPSITRGGNLDDAQAAAAYLLQNLGGRPVALILFASEPYLVSALTLDPRTVASSIAVLDDQTMPDTGSNPGRALALASGVFTDAGIIGGDVIILSDGGGISASAHTEAKLIAKSGARLSTVYIAPTATPDGIPEPKPTALGQLARVGGGQAVDWQDLNALVTLLQHSRNPSFVRSDIAPLLFNDFGRYLLLIVLFPALLLFRRSKS